MRRFLLILAMLLPGLALAQDDDKGFLTGLLERNLSSAGREVTINGFSGALSSRATIAEILIADDQGTWLTLRGAALDWNRAALLRGRVSVNTLSAKEIIVTRPPVPPEGITPPPAAAPGFSLPQLPVSIRIDRLQVERLTLGEAVLGQAAVLELEAAAALADGAGDLRMRLDRIDGKNGLIAFDGGFSNETRMLRVDLSAVEGPGGLIAGLTGLAGAPSLSLTVAGTGPLNDYSADLTLATDGQERLAGRVVLGTNDAGWQTFNADLGGDIAALVAPDHRGFFGTDIALELSGAKESDGRLDITRLRLDTAALSLGGRLGISAEGLPDLIDLTGSIASGDGTAVLLPLGGPPTRLNQAGFEIGLGAPDDPEALRLSAQVTGLTRPGLALGTLALSGKGRVSQASRAVGLDIDFSATGIAPGDAGLARAIGPSLTGAARIDGRRGAPLRLPEIQLEGLGYGLRLTEVELGGLEAAARISGQATGRLDDLSRFSGLAGRPLSGAGDLEMTGRYAALSGEGEVELVLNGRDLGLGQSELDALLRGASRVALAAFRDETGTTLRALEVEAGSLGLSASGVLTPGAGDLVADLTFSDLSVLGPGYGGSLTASSRVTGATDGTQDITATARGNNLRTGTTELDGLLAGETAIDLVASRRGDMISIDNLTARNDALSFRAQGLFAGASSDLTADFNLPDLGVMGPAYRGALDARARVTGEAGAQRIDLDANASNVALGIARIDRLLRDGLALSAIILRGDTRLTLQDARLAAASLTARASGVLTAGAQDVSADLALADLSDIDPRFGGAVTARARVADAKRGRHIEVTGGGASVTVGIPEIDRLLKDGLALTLRALQTDAVIDLEEARAQAASLILSARGRIENGASALTADLTFDNLSDLGPRYGGAARAEARLREDGGTRHVALAGTGRNLAVGPAEANRLLRGQTDLTLVLTEEAGRIEVRQADLSNPQFAAQSTATLHGPDTAARFTARMADLGLIVPGLNGPLTTEGNVTGSAAGYDIALSLAGPGGMEARVDGSAAPDFAAVDLGIAGVLQTALANPFLSPRLIDGPARFDLRLNGAPGPQAMSGTITVAGARLVDPGLGLSLQDIRAQVALGSGNAVLDVTGTVGSGGRIALTGPVALAVPIDASLKLVLDRVILRNPELFETELRGALDVTGPLTGGALIAGDIRLRETEIRVPSTGLGGAGALPELQHVNEPGNVRDTRARAGLLERTDETGGTNRARPFRLDVMVRAPERIFIRGRGLDAELGGELRVTGTTDDIIPIGAFELIRGRLDILGQRFDLDEGSALLQGELIPFINLSASTRTDDVQATIVVSGPATAPDISFRSVPELPEEEVLAQILFGRDLSQISAFQALQLASAVQTLAGRGGAGIVSRLRQGAGLDNLDVITDAEGNTGVQAGKYISRRIYTDLTVDSTGRSEIKLNIDITKSLTARGSVANDGSTGIGMFFERDY